MKSKPTLSHRKSTSSARSVILEHLDPAVAQRDAQIAAHQAFARAQDRSSTEMALFPPPPSPSLHRQPYLHDASSRDASAEPSIGLGDTTRIPRRQSVRFVGPCTVQNRGSTSRQRPRTPASSVCGAVDPANVVESTDGQHLKVPTLPQPQIMPRTSSSTHSTKAVGDYLNALVAEDNSYTPEDDIASVPSSYRRLRKSRSSRPLRGAGNARDSGDSYHFPSTDPTREVRTSMSMRTLNSSQTKENVKPQKIPTLKAPKSMSFLKGRRERILSITSHDSDTSNQVNMSTGHTPLRTKTSSFFASKSRRAETGLRKSLRSSSSRAELAPPLANTSTLLPKGERGSLRNKARKASKTLKSKLLNLFSSTKGDDDAEFPDQHVKSQKNRMENDIVSNGTGLDEHTQSGSGNERPLPYDHPNMSEAVSASRDSRACSRKASLRAFEDQVWGPGSNEHGALDDKSRVTSWTNSGPSTLTSEQQLAWKEWEKQRLSIIRENGSHCPSPSLQRQAIGQHVLQSQESLVGQPILPGPTIDSQRVYAALMERLAETTQLAQVVEQQRKSLAGTTSAPFQISMRPDFEDYEDNGAKPAPLAVRRALSKESLTKCGHDANIPREAPCDRARDGQNLLPPVALAPWNSNYSPTDGEGVVSAERSNTFFGSPETHLFRTVSPYRRALRKSIEEAEGELHGRNSVSRIVSEYGTEIRRPEEAFYDDAYSESVYSSDEPAAGPATNTIQPLMQVVKEQSCSPGKMSMSVDPPVTYQPTGHRDVSSVSSIDWKTWLSANVARLEPSPSPPRPAAVGFALPSMPSSLSQGHVREGAQIEEDEDLGSPHQDVPETHKPRFETSPLAMWKSDASKRSPYQNSVARTTPQSAGVLIEIDNQWPSSERREFVDAPLSPPELPPPIPPRSPLRHNPSPVSANAKSAKELQDGEASVSQTRDSHAHKRSRAPLREMNNNADSPGTPTPKPTRLQKKRSGFLYTPSVAVSNAATSPGLTAAVERQFGLASKQTASSDENKENEVAEGLHGIRKSGVLNSVDEERSARSMRVVDVFLGSRRKRMASCETDSPAFV
ncbi:hypothetical protein BR93DRAFT_926935 [Coniochaeta sp. PMI_546]|nr:hypothetical protein BR93DRAFT_926935 [Coniochaeta sp. PMI_546]